MRKIVLKTLGGIALAAAAVTPSATASAQYGNSGYQLLYERYVYDDAEMTIQVGYERDECYHWGAGGGETQGRYGPYKTEQVWAVCDNGRLEPYGG